MTFEVKLMKEVELAFCMKQFKPAIVVLAILVAVVIGWTGWHCVPKKARNIDFALAAATAPAKTSPAPFAKKINVKDKMAHPYWGNCNKCHITVDAGKPVSRVMASAPISIKDKMPHKYWGNCLMCHKVIDGLQPGQVRAAAANMLTAGSLGLKTQTVTGAMMRDFGLTTEDGVFVLEVAPNSIAAIAGIQKGDEIIRAGKTRVETTNSFEAVLNQTKPGGNLKINIYRGKKQKNLFVKIPKNLSGDLTPAAVTAPMTQNQVETLAEQLGVPKTQQDVTRALRMQDQAQATTPAAATAPMTQNQVETLAEQLGVPKTQQDVTRALARQKQAQAAANLNFGKVAVAASGPGLDYQVSHQFGASPYLIIFDPSLNSYRVVANPNANDATDRGIQTGQYVVDQGASSAVAGTFSLNALHTLNDLRVNAYSGVVGPVRDAISIYMAGGLAPANTAQSLQAARSGGNTSSGAGSRSVVPIY